MSEVRVDDSLTTYYEDDYFGEPWLTPETVLMIHGAGESSLAWYAWVPHLARHYRVLRMDQRGLGRSSPPPPDFVWGPEALAKDIAGFMDATGVKQAHIIGAKIGGTVAAQFAVDYPERVLSLTLVTAPIRRANPREAPVDSGQAILAAGTRKWAEDSQRARLGSVSDSMIAWWNDLMATSSAAACAGYAGMMSRLDNFKTLRQIKAATLFVAVTRDGKAGRPLEEAQQQVVHSELFVLPGDGYHVGATNPDECAERVLAFIGLHSSSAYEKGSRE